MSRIDRLIQKTYRKKLWTPFIRAIKDFELIEDGDKIAVAISGGKDSFLLAKLFQELYKHGNRNFEVSYFVMDPGYEEEHRKHILDTAEALELPITIFEREIFDVAMKLDEKPCYMCARMRRGHLYSITRELGCNKLALGHHFDDVVETALMNVLSAGTTMAMMPKLHSTNFPGLELIRPLYYIEEKDIIRFSKETGLTFLNCACKVSTGEIVSNRKRIRILIESLKDDFPNLKKSIYYSTVNVHTEAILGSVRKGIHYSFLETYHTPKED
ncbi:tRNA 2-thiocytidine biosynthesis TtcA family protein [Guggenheimella bovis]